MARWTKLIARLARGRYHLRVAAILCGVPAKPRRPTDLRRTARAADPRSAARRPADRRAAARRRVPHQPHAGPRSTPPPRGRRPPDPRPSGGMRPACRASARCASSTTSGWRSRSSSCAAPRAPGTSGSLEALEQEWRALDAQRGAAGSRRRRRVRRPGRVLPPALGRGVGKRVRCRSCGDIGDRIRILRIHDFTSEERISATITEHLEIVRAVIAGDADVAAGYMRAHIQRSANVVRERIGEALARMFEDPAVGRAIKRLRRPDPPSIAASARGRCARQRRPSRRLGGRAGQRRGLAATRWNPQLWRGLRPPCSQAPQGAGP